MPALATPGPPARAGQAALADDLADSTRLGYENSALYALSAGWPPRWA
jgi:hypothetical protein